MTRPAISVLMPVYNAARYLAEAVDSILAQTFRDFELVIVNDGSTDGSADVVRATSADVPWQPITLATRGRNGGLAAARNLGVELSRADYVFMLDDDNAVHPRGLRLLAEALDAAPPPGSP